jgi:sulfofructose kinase
MKKRWDVLGIGVVTVDDLLYLDHYPRADEKIPVKMHLRQGGGLTATALVAAARQGAQTAFCGRLGEDELSRFSFQEFAREGIDVSPTMRVPDGRPFHSIIIIDIKSGSRTIIYNAEGVAEPDPTDITEEMVASSRVLFIDHFAYNSGIRAASFAHSHGVPVVSDIESVSLPNLAYFLSQIDHLIVNIEFARQVTGEQDIKEMVRSLAGRGRAAAVVTDGAKGCWYAENGGQAAHFPAFQVKVVDTTGCGDVFHGAYAAAIARGECVNRAIRVATATAGLKAGQPGGRSGIPDLAKVEKFLKAQA